MQPLVGGPRSGFSEEAVRALLQSQSAIKITYGAMALDANFGAVADISGYMGAGSTITSDITATVQRTCSLNIDADVTDTGWSYLSGFVRPYQTFTDVATGVSATFYLGVYTLTTPKRALGTVPATLNFQGYDLNYLLNLPIGDSYEVAMGQDAAQAAATVIGIAIPGVQVQASPTGTTLAKQMTWPLNTASPVTYMTIVNDLLASVGYRQLWVDWEGVFRIEPFTDLQQQSFEWTFDAQSDTNILAEARDQSIDLFDVPNSFLFVMANLTESPVEGLTQFSWVDSSASNPGSTANRGRVVHHVEEVTVLSYTDLLTYAQRTILNMLRPSETFDITMQPFPLIWHLDVLQYRDTALASALPIVAGAERRVCVTHWTLPLDGQTDATLTWQTLSDQDATLGLTVTTAVVPVG